MDIRRSTMDIEREGAYVIGRAQERIACFVTLGPLVFFSTPCGDAWMLDPRDGLALWLACDGLPLPVGIEETPEAFSVAWDRQFRIEGDVFTAADSAGRVDSFTDYPTTSILEAIGRAMPG
jgi:hypothetical protein